MFLCKDATLRMTDAREGALSGLTGVKVRVHLLICPHCRACRRQLDDTIALAGETRREASAPAIDPRVIAALRARAGRE
jgi:anti-sigma factor ChrR (cupin superfamily)